MERIFNKPSLKKLTILAGILLTGCSISPPKEYVGTWMNKDTSLEIKKAGQLKYSAPGHKISFPIAKITDAEIAGSWSFIFSLPIDGPPQQSSNGGKFLVVNGEKLYSATCQRYSKFPNNVYLTPGQTLANLAVEKAADKLACALLGGCDENTVTTEETNKSVTICSPSTTN